MKNEIKLSEKAKKIIGGWLCIGLLLILGIVLLTTSKYNTITGGDFVEKTITFGRIHTFSGEDVSYAIFSQGDENSFRIDNIVANLFNKTKFDSQVASGENITLTVLQSEYDKGESSVDTLGVRKDESVFLDFEKAFNKRTNNDKIAYIASLVILPLAGALIVGFTIYTVLYKKGKIKNKDTAVKKEKLNIAAQSDKITIKIPVKLSTVFYYSIGTATLIAIFAFAPMLIKYAQPIGFYLIMSFMLLFALWYIASFILMFFRKIVIDKQDKTITYFSMRKRTFQIGDIVSMENKTYSDSEGPDTYALVIKLNTNKKIKIKTYSDGQSLALSDELLSLKDPYSPPPA